LIHERRIRFGAIHVGHCNKGGELFQNLRKEIRCSFPLDGRGLRRGKS
jgi:hypothetical protein